MTPSELSRNPISVADLDIILGYLDVNFINAYTPDCLELLASKRKLEALRDAMDTASVGLMEQRVGDEGI